MLAALLLLGFMTALSAEEADSTALDLDPEGQDVFDGRVRLFLPEGWQMAELPIENGLRKTACGNDDGSFKIEALDMPTTLKSVDELKTTIEDYGKTLSGAACTIKVVQMGGVPWCHCTTTYSDHEVMEMCTLSPWRSYLCVSVTYDTGSEERADECKALAWRMLFRIRLLAGGDEAQDDPFSGFSPAESEPDAKTPTPTESQPDQTYDEVIDNIAYRRQFVLDGDLSISMPIDFLSRPVQSEHGRKEQYTTEKELIVVDILDVPTAIKDMAELKQAIEAPNENSDKSRVKVWTETIGEHEWCLSMTTFLERQVLEASYLTERGTFLCISCGYDPSEADLMAGVSRIMLHSLRFPGDADLQPKDPIESDPTALSLDDKPLAVITVESREFVDGRVVVQIPVELKAPASAFSVSVEATEEDASLDDLEVYVGRLGKQFEDQHAGATLLRLELVQFNGRPFAFIEWSDRDEVRALALSALDSKLLRVQAKIAASTGEQGLNGLIQMFGAIAIND